MIQVERRAPSTRRQATLLLGLWWRHMRRRPARVGEAPKLSGMPSFLLMNLISIGYLAPLVWSTVRRDMERGEAWFAWHMLGILIAGLGNGATKAAGTFQVRGARHDAFLEPLPLRPLAALALPVIDNVLLFVLALIVPLAGAQALGPFGVHAVAAALLGVVAYLAFFLVGYAATTCARALGPLTVARYATYSGLGLGLVGMAATILPLASFLGPQRGRALGPLTRWWLIDASALFALYAGLIAATFLAYRALLAAERIGFDRLQVAWSRAPKASKVVRSRESLEWLMMWRNGGKIAVGAFSVVLVGGVSLFAQRPHAIAIARVGLYLAGLAVYLGALLVIGQAGGAARRDLMARPFLSALPLSPYQVLEGKARALRKLVIPVFAMLGLVLIACVISRDLSTAYRTALALAALYVVVDGAIGIAFLSTGVGVVGLGGGQASSSFSTQLLMMPLLTTLLAPDAWIASVSFIAVVAVTFETKRAAHRSVRWIDDADDTAERETTVWRALLAATAFFAMQILTARLLDLFDVAPGYMLASAFAASGAVLALLTFRNSARFEAARFWPRSPIAWPLGVLGGCASGLLALQLTKLLPRPDTSLAEPSSGGELIAIFATMTVVAPLAEEYFFRGWLQKAIEKDLPEGKKHFAFALGALAFALAHIGTYGVPQLVLGLIAGALYAFGGGLWPAILAHAAHNCVVLLQS